ncbi:MAG: metallophosphoesterase family protein [Acidilobus sp.]
MARSSRPTDVSDGHKLKVMIISDLHYNIALHGRIDESVAWRWLMRFVRLQAPDLLIGLGDWGEAINRDELTALLRVVRLWSIYGNHDYVQVLSEAHNGDGEPVLLEDGEVRRFGGLRFGAINGVVSLTGRMKGGVPTKRPEEFIRVGRRLAGKVDVLLLHDSPRLPLPAYSSIIEDGRPQAVEAAISEARPRLAVCGHLHISPCTLFRRDDGVTCARVISSQEFKHYLVLYPGDMRLEFWREYDRVKCLP